jgi:hypothetical protein
MPHNQLASKNERYQVRDLALAGTGQRTSARQMTTPARHCSRTAAGANCRFRPEQWVYNRDTKEHGLVRRVYKRDGVTMYKAWLPATPDLLHWGHFVSDWAEGVLERADDVLRRSHRLADSR